MIVPLNVQSEWKGADAKRAIVRGAKVGMTTALTQLLRNAVAITPREFGPLRDSAAWELIPGNTDILQGMVTYDAPYAVFVHEITGRNHPVGQDHFLSTALELGQQQIAKFFAAGIRRELV